MTTYVSISEVPTVLEIDTHNASQVATAFEKAAGNGVVVSFITDDGAHHLVNLGRVLHIAVTDRPPTGEPPTAKLYLPPSWFQ